MSARSVNILIAELNHVLDESGFRHAAAQLGSRLGARRIGAGLYQGEAGFPIWPYHYHHGVEEWLYVIEGAPVLREAAGERALKPGDIVCFPSGPVGAHTAQGPGRFVIFSAGYQGQPYMSVYPDSDKASGPEGILLRSSAVGYWHGEGTAGPMEPEPERRRREPEPSVALPAVNALSTEPGRLGALLGAERLDATVVDLDPGAESEPYHYVWGREEWLLVLGGEATVRHPRGEDRLGACDVVCFLEGPEGARQLRNDSDLPMRALLLSTTGLPANVCYPETGDWLLRNADGHELETRAP
jgi:uncharacterized cupin superfamily protein